ncbi:ATP-binding cassette domain-containing protein [Cellulomonas sp. ACRRI]|uniref:ATP-binding cassette domain-containing protein n=1 Tax=Cellulomonas sp. ACRRI TaxID=2918188 RepID=UPI001EF168EE|nr:ATP-binding cassette domain-containing protein [Cellulomonas sp. ACRRI]MCG7287345.1 ATP-binding cassette domain-containing protein [Cellulomonas sp. ACRRI]
MSSEPTPTREAEQQDVVPAERPAPSAPSVPSVPSEQGDLEQQDPGTGSAPPSLAVRARGLVLTGSRGAVYGPVDLDLPAGALTVVQGPQGAGRSSLLLTLAGRMVPDRGSDLTVLGEDLPRRRTAVQRRAAVAGFAGVDELDDSVTVGDVTRERLAWLSPWYRWTGRVSQERFAALAGPVFGERPLPRVSTVIWDLDEVDAMLLRVTLALAQEPDLLVVDDVDQVHDSGRRQTVWTRLEAVAAAGTTVIASVASLDEVARMRWWTTPEVANLATGPHAVPAA